MKPSVGIAGGTSVTHVMAEECLASSSAEEVMLQGAVLIPVVFIVLFLP